ncbi:VIT domain-containing protein, partial [Rhizobium ruizarguesonis]
FPLPDNSAVDALKMQIGERFIEGQIKPRQEAREIYEQAKAEGKKTALLEQQRPNIFTNQVANIGPSETIVVQIEYQQM